MPPSRSTYSDESIIETMVVVDRDFANLFQQDYQKIVNYLTSYFWDVNMRFKSLWSVDISIRINGLIVMTVCSIVGFIVYGKLISNSIVCFIQSDGDQPFIENARGCDGRTEFGRMLNLFSYWTYQERRSIQKHDLAVLITNSNLESEGGLSHAGGICSVDKRSGFNWGTAVWSDNGQYRSILAAVREIAHTLGAFNIDDDPVNCPGPYNTCKQPDYDQRFFFHSCSNSAISSFVK